ncbi:antitoxin [Bacillus marasmi]|uniref:antitoxin n=1 Tax=Bacillus marasmi TaxID=1926279 RepID=UPI0011C90721|nr:antitoxin [Bacillus marasmi]
MHKNNSLGGRPPGRRKTAKIEILIEPEIKFEFMNLMRKEGKMASIEIGTWIKGYIKEMNKSDEK